MGDYKKPVPAPTEETAPYHRSARDHSLAIQRCDDCGQFWMPAGPICRHCWSSRFTWTPITGKGRVYAWVVVHQAYHPGFHDELPYNLTLVELDEGPRLLTNLVGIANEEIRPDLPVRVVYEDITQDATLVKFCPDRT